MTPKKNESVRRRMRNLLLLLLGSAIVSFYGLRMVTKGASFHYLEREYAVNLHELSRSIEKASKGEPQDKADVIKMLDYSRWISGHVDTELFGFEHWAFRWMGFSRVIDLPHDSIRRVTDIRSRLEEVPSTHVPHTVARALEPEATELIRYGNEFANEVSAAVGFISFAVRVLIGLCLACLGVSVWRLERALVGPLEGATQLAQAVSQGDLGIKARDGRRLREDEIGALVCAVHRIQDAFKEVVANVSQCSHGVLLGSGEIASGSADLSIRTEDQAARVQQASAAMTQMAEAVQSSAGNASAANLAAGQAVEKARQGREVMRDAMRTMQEIAASSDRIASIIAVIDGIAFQTNLLALNASVEAAHAGASGRGFAVVADEVRNLAGRAAESAREIKFLIGASAEKVETGSRLVDRAGRSMEEIVAEVERVRQLIGSISTMVAQQSSGIDEIAEAIASLEDATQQNAALVEQSAAASQSLRQQADKLCDAVAFFHLPPQQDNRVPLAQASALVTAAQACA